MSNPQHCNQRPANNPLTERTLHLPGVTSRISKQTSTIVSGCVATHVRRKSALGGLPPRQPALRSVRRVRGAGLGQDWRERRAGWRPEQERFDFKSEWTPNSPAPSTGGASFLTMHGCTASRHRRRDLSSPSWPPRGLGGGRQRSRDEKKVRSWRLPIHFPVVFHGLFSACSDPSQLLMLNFSPSVSCYSLGSGSLTCLF